MESTSDIIKHQFRQTRLSSAHYGEQGTTGWKPFAQGQVRSGNGLLGSGVERNKKVKKIIRLKDRIHEVRQKR